VVAAAEAAAPVVVAVVAAAAGIVAISCQLPVDGSGARPHSIVAVLT
jgi:hypothetical protein